MKNINVVKIQAVRDRSLPYETNHVSSPDVAIGILKTFINECCHTDRESFVVMCLDTKNKVTALTLVSIGTINNTLVHPREVFKAAILSNSASIILAHNHPSGDANPSHEDIEVTKRIKDAGSIIGIEVIDHIIIGDEKTTSLKANGLL